MWLERLTQSLLEQVNTVVGYWIAAVNEEHGEESFSYANSSKSQLHKSRHELQVSVAFENIVSDLWGR